MTAMFPLRWPDGWKRTPDVKRKDSNRFEVGPEKAVKELYNTLVRLGAKSIVVSSHLQVGVRGGLMLGNARGRLPDPGAAVYFWRSEREFVLAQDAFDTVLGNLRSIGIALEALRTLERHGGAHLAERAFGGFAALPPPEKPFNWREELGIDGIQLHNPTLAKTIAEAAYKQLAKGAHPDNGGNAERMARLNKAIEKAREELKTDG